MKVTFTITEPVPDPAGEQPTAFAETYHAIFTLNRDEDDP